MCLVAVDKGGVWGVIFHEKAKTFIGLWDILTNHRKGGNLEPM